MIRGDLRQIRGTDVIARSGGVIVAVRGARPRAVPVLARYHALLLAAAAFAWAGLVTGGAKTARKNVTARQNSSLAGGGGLPRPISASTGPAATCSGRAGAGWPGSNCPPTSREIVADCLAVIDGLAPVIDRVDGELRVHAKADPRVKVLTTLPGVGQFTALVLLAEIGDISRFGSARKLAAKDELHVSGSAGSSATAWRTPVSRRKMIHSAIAPIWSVENRSISDSHAGYATNLTGIRRNRQ